MIWWTMYAWAILHLYILSYYPRSLNRGKLKSKCIIILYDYYHYWLQLQHHVLYTFPGWLCEDDIWGCRGFMKWRIELMYNCMIQVPPQGVLVGNSNRRLIGELTMGGFKSVFGFELPLTFLAHLSTLHCQRPHLYIIPHGNNGSRSYQWSTNLLTVYLWSDCIAPKRAYWRAH